MWASAISKANKSQNLLRRIRTTRINCRFSVPIKPHWGLYIQMQPRSFEKFCLLLHWDNLCDLEQFSAWPKWWSLTYRVLNKIVFCSVLTIDFKVLNVFDQLCQIHFNHILIFIALLDYNSLILFVCVCACMWQEEYSLRMETKHKLYQFFKVTLCKYKCILF